MFKQYLIPQKIYIVNDKKEKQFFGDLRLNGRKFLTPTLRFAIREITCMLLVQFHSLFQIAEIVNKQLDNYFPASKHSNLRVIAEPGTYYAASAFTVVTNVIAKRKVVLPVQESKIEKGKLLSVFKSFIKYLFFYKQFFFFICFFSGLTQNYVFNIAKMNVSGRVSVSRHVLIYVLIHFFLSLGLISIL